MIRKAVDWATWAMEWTANACFAVTILLVVVSVALRPLQIAAPWSDEGACLLYIWTIFLAAAVALRRNVHIRIDVMLVKLPSRVKDAVLWVMDLMCLPFCLGLVWGTYQVMQASVHMRSSVLEVSLLLYYLPLLIGFTMMAVYCTLSIFDYFLAKPEKGEGR